MGSRIGGVVPAGTCRLRELAGSVVAVDAMPWLHEFLKVMHERPGSPRQHLVLMDRSCRVINNLRGFFFRTVRLVQQGIWPVFVFDGVAAGTVRGAGGGGFEQGIRHGVGGAAWEHHARLARVHGAALQRGMDVLAANIGKTMAFAYPVATRESRRLLSLMGMPVVHATGEAEKTCAALGRAGIVDHVVSSDSDVLLHGAPSVIKKLSPVKPSTQLERVELADALAELGLDLPGLVDAAILVGTDFNSGVPGVGPKTALRLVRAHGSIERAALLDTGRDYSCLGLPNPARSTSSALLDDLRRFYLDDGDVALPGEVEWTTPSRTGVARLLSADHGLDAGLVKKGLDALVAVMGC